MTREEVLQAAAKCVNGDRQEDYGSPENNFGLVAAFWNAYLRPCMRPNIIGIDSKDVAAMLGLLKIARIATGHGKADNWIDLAGYAACGGELERAEEATRSEACKEKVKPQIGLAARKFGRRGEKKSAAQISHHKVPA